MAMTLPSKARLVLLRFVISISSYFLRVTDGALARGITPYRFKRNDNRPWAVRRTHGCAYHSTAAEKAQGLFSQIFVIFFKKRLRQQKTPQGGEIPRPAVFYMAPPARF